MELFLLPVFVLQVAPPVVLFVVEFLVLPVVVYLSEAVSVSVPVPAAAALTVVVAEEVPLLLLQTLL